MPGASKREWERDHYSIHQFGQALEVDVSGGGDLVVVAKDCVRWKGEGPWDVRPWRVYLAPWQPRANIDVIPLATGAYATPTPWVTPPGRYDSFVSVPIYARIQWGAGGLSNTAYVDWPKRGLLLQASGSYIQVDGVGNTSVGGTDVNELPILGATLGPEPGGGDAAAPATYTYRRQLPDETGTAYFQIPPFARSFHPLLDRPALIAAGATTVQIATFNSPALAFIEDAYELNLDECPCLIPVTNAATIVRISTGLAPVDATRFIGCLFQLDL